MGASSFVQVVGLGIDIIGAFFLIRGSSSVQARKRQLNLGYPELLEKPLNKT